MPRLRSSWEREAVYMAKGNRVNANSEGAPVTAKVAKPPRAGEVTGKPVSRSKRPKLGQNFLADRSAAEKIVEAIGEVSQRRVIEIGPGAALDIPFWHALHGFGNLELLPGLRALSK